MGSEVISGYPWQVYLFIYKLQNVNVSIELRVNISC